MLAVGGFGCTADWGFVGLLRQVTEAERVGKGSDLRSFSPSIQLTSLRNKASEKLSHEKYWACMAWATRVVDSWPEWEKGSPDNTRKPIGAVSARKSVFGSNTRLELPSWDVVAAL